MGWEHFATRRRGLILLPAKARSDSALLGALVTRAQAEQDLKTLGASVPASTVALTVTPTPQTTPRPPSTTLYMPPSGEDV